MEGGEFEHLINKADILPVEGKFSFHFIISCTFHLEKNDVNHIMARKKDIKEIHD